VHALLLIQHSAHTTNNQAAGAGTGSTRTKGTLKSKEGSKINDSEISSHQAVSSY